MERMTGDGARGGGCLGVPSLRPKGNSTGSGVGFKGYSVWAVTCVHARVCSLHTWRRRMSPAVPRAASRTQPVWEELPSFTSISPGESLPLMELAPGCLGCSQHFAAALDAASVTRVLRPSSGGLVYLRPRNHGVEGSGPRQMSSDGEAALPTPGNSVRGGGGLLPASHAG